MRKHLLTASVMAAPATIVIAKILVPETGDPLTRGQVRMEVERTTTGVIDAAAAWCGRQIAARAQRRGDVARVRGADRTHQLAVEMVRQHPWGASQITIDAWLTGVSGHPVTLSLQSLLGYVLSPIAWVIGVPWQDATIVGSLIGQKVVLNEFVAYIGLADIINGHAPGLTLSPQGTLIATYALCGFANFSSIAIQIGGIGGLAPSVVATLRVSECVPCSVVRSQPS
jgi:CNT family concentrative nucleoside transporter